ncbi:MAG: WXG100 family type VII secretion target [Lachnospiraceae bacterium]|nr:WXG100 family type VII secretion target [Lachnospiraceae bacterium]
MAASGESRVNTQQFLSTADTLQAIFKDLQNQFHAWEQTMNSLRGQWQGDCSDDIRALTNQVKSSSNALLTNLQGYRTALREMAGVYDKTEKAVQEKGRSLKKGSVMR